MPSFAMDGPVHHCPEFPDLAGCRRRDLPKREVGAGAESKSCINDRIVLILWARFLTHSVEPHCTLQVKS